VSVETADEAVLLHEERGDFFAVLTDVDMPGTMDGLEFAALLRDCWPDLAIIIVSGLVRPSPGALPTKALFLPKPYSAEDLAKALSAL